LRTQVSLTEEQMARLRREARRRGVSLAAVVRDAVDRAVPDEDVARIDRLERALRAAGSVASGTGDVAVRHDDVLSGERW
jgi:Ribbon-helix-helix protein, copG family